MQKIAGTAASLVLALALGLSLGGSLSARESSDSAATAAAADRPAQLTHQVDEAAHGHPTPDWDPLLRKPQRQPAGFQSRFFAD